jgi:hypothetical protein
MKSFSNLLTLFLVAIFFSSCLKDTADELSGIKGIKASNEFSMPLVNMTMGMKELYESALSGADVHEDANNLLVFTYQSGDTVPTAPFPPFPAVAVNYNIQLPAAAIQVFNFTDSFEVNIDSSLTLPTAGNEQIKLIKVKEGSFSITVTNAFRHNAIVSISYPGISKNGVPHVDNIVLNYDPNNFPLSITHTLNLADYDIDFSKGGTSFNEIAFSYKVSLKRIPGNSTTTTDFLGIGQNFQIVSQSKTIGYLGKFPIITAHQSQDIDLFTAGINGKILVNDPRLVLRIFNSYGIPITGRIYNLRIITVDSQYFPVVIDQFRDTFSFQKPTNPGDIAVSEYRIDNTNSNLDDAINSGPSHIEFDIEFVANYNDIIQDNFLIEGSTFRTEIDFQLPMDIKILDYEVEERSTLSLSDLSIKGAESATFFVKTENGLPFDVAMQMYFVTDTVIAGVRDSNFVVDSLFSHALAIPGAVVDGNGQVVTPYSNITSVSVPIKRFA